LVPWTGDSKIGAGHAAASRSGLKLVNAPQSNDPMNLRSRHATLHGAGIATSGVFGTIELSGVSAFATPRVVTMVETPFGRGIALDRNLQNANSHRRVARR
jgi:hypothetical protein